MQEIVHNLYNGPDSLRASLILRAESNGDLFNDQSILTSDSDNCNSASEDYQINFNQTSHQDFGLSYWIKHTNPPPYEPKVSHCNSPKNSAFNHNLSGTHKPVDKAITKLISDSSCKENSKKPKHNSKSKGKQKAKEKKHTKSITAVSLSHSSKSNSRSNYNIPPLKIPKEVVKKYLKTLPPSCSSSSSSSEAESPHNQNITHNLDKIKKKSKSKTYISDMPLSDHDDSSCLQKSFLSSSNSKPQSVYSLSTASHDNMLFTMTIDSQLVHNISSLPVINSNPPDSSKIITDSLLSGSNENDALKTSGKREVGTMKHNIINNNINDVVRKSERNENQICLSTNCDKQDLKIDKINDNDDQIENFESTNQLSAVNNRKRVLNQRSECDQEIGVAAKKQMLDSTNRNSQISDYQRTAVYYLKFLMEKMKNFEEMIHEKYCLSQPNAMKYLAQNHATQWESNKNDSNQLHLVPCEFIAEIFHRALHCYGLEKRLLKETIQVDSSPFSRFDNTHSTEYKKIRDEYSFSLKRVRYGIGVIDDLFKRKINFQSTLPNSDVIVVRKWKHLIYYLCLQAKAVFMTKEMQYHNYANYVNQSSSFDGDCNILFNGTPTARYSSSSLVVETNNKLQFPKDSSKLFESKFPKTTPEHLSQFDMDVSPHSYDSGKGSSIRLSSNGNSQVSGCHTTSSLNSTPHSLNEAQLNLPGFHMYRIDEYLKTANEYVQFLPETFQLHSKVISKIGFEPNANSSDNMLRFINYTEVCQQICKQEAMSECLQRLLNQAVRL